MCRHGCCWIIGRLLGGQQRGLPHLLPPAQVPGPLPGQRQGGRALQQQVPQPGAHLRVPAPQLQPPLRYEHLLLYNTTLLTSVIWTASSAACAYATL